MKKLFIFIVLALFGFVPYHASAQINVGINIGSQPLWGPTGYDHVDYYYLPDIESYYYVPTREFIHLNNGNWIHTSNLPSRYRSYNLYNGYKVIINSPKPYLNFKEQKVKYAKYKSNHSQKVILKSNNPKYYVVKNHPKHSVKINNNQGKPEKNKSRGGAKGHSGSNSKGKGKH